MKKSGALTVAVMVVATVCSGAFADSIAWREGGGGIYTDVTCDDTFAYSYGSSEVHGNDDYLYVRYSGAFSPGRVILIGWADLFTSVPVTSAGNPVIIDNATLKFTKYSSSAPGAITISEVEVPWLTGTAGTSESNVTAEYSDLANTTTWTSGDFSSADWISASEVTYDATSAAQYETFSVNITNLMQQLYDNGVNNGFALWDTNSTGMIYQLYSSEATTVDYRPALEMEYHYEGGGEVPEPGMLLLMGTGLLGLAGYVRRKRLN